MSEEHNRLLHEVLYFAREGGDETITVQGTSLAPVQEVLRIV